MGLADYLKDWDPKAGEVRAYPLHMLPNIVSRARELLGSWTGSKIASVLLAIDLSISEFFEDQKWIKITNLEETVNGNYIWYTKSKLTPAEDAKFEDALRFVKNKNSDPDSIPEFVFDEEMIDELAVANSWNTTEAQALIESVGRWRMEDKAFFLSGEKHYECFAILALGLAAKAQKESDDARELPNEFPSLDGLMLANIYVTRAMEAVCIAEASRYLAESEVAHVAHIAKIEAAAQEALERRGSQQAELASSFVVLAKQAESLEAEREAKRKELARRMKSNSDAAHAPNREAKQLARGEWGTGRFDKMTGERAAESLCKWLEQKGKHLALSTVRRWVSEFRAKTASKMDA